MPGESIKDLRKQLKEKRSSTVKAPSKMTKAEVLAELGHKEDAVMKTLERTVAPPSRPAVKKAEKALEVIHAKEAVVMKDIPAKKAPKKAAAIKESLPPKPVKDLPKPNEVPVAKTSSESVKKLVKGSQEARDYMAAIRAKKSAAKNVD
jgi:hypothetical protein